MPAKYGAALPLVVFAGGQSSAEYSPVLFSYDPPVVDSVSPTDTFYFDAEAGCRVDIHGYNFGLTGASTIPHGTVFIGDTECLTVLFVNDVQVCGVLGSWIMFVGSCAGE